MNQAGSQYYDCEFHSSGPFNDAGVTLLVEISKSGDGNLMIQSETMHPFDSGNVCVVTEEGETSTNKVVMYFV